MTMARLLRGLVLALVGAGFATAAGAVDMTGTWEGRERCDCVNEVDGRFARNYRDQVMEITQDGTDLNIEAYGELFNGNVIGHPRRNSRGEAALIACDTDPTDNASFGEAARAKVLAKASGGGSMTIESLWNAKEDEVCTCRSKMRRTDASDPEVGGCSESSKLDEWSLGMHRVDTSGAGCHVASYPDPVWTKVDCGEPPAKRARIADGPNVRAARRPPVWWIAANGGTLSQVTGSFENVSGVTGIADSVQGDDYWTLQMNSSRYDTPVCDTGGASCKGWLQFLYHNYPVNRGALNIWYWLLYYGDSCPDGWRQSGDHCYISTSMHWFSPHVAATDLEKIQFSASAKANDNDQITFRTSDGKLYSVTAPDSTAELAQGWTRAEFNIHGAGNRSDAHFDENSSFDVKLEVPASSGTITCEQHMTTTAESTNLTAGAACAEVEGASHPTFKFTQSND